MARLTLVSEGSGSLSELQPAYRHLHLRCCSYLGCRYQRKGGSRNDTHGLIMGYIWSSSILHCKWCSHGTSDMINTEEEKWAPVVHCISICIIVRLNHVVVGRVLLWCFSYTGIHKTLLLFCLCHLYTNFTCQMTLHLWKCSCELTPNNGSLC